MFKISKIQYDTLHFLDFGVIICNKYILNDGRFNGATFLSRKIKTLYLSIIKIII